MVRIVIICIALALALSNVNATTSTLKSTLYESVPEDTGKNKLPTPIKLLENLATLENEAVAAIYKFNNTIGQTKKLVNNLKLKGKVNRSDVCWQYIAAQMRYRTTVEKDAVTAINMRYQKLIPLLQKGGKNLTQMFTNMVNEGKKCRTQCRLDEFTLEAKNKTMNTIQQGHAACAAKISALAADLEAKEQAKREQLENARAIVKAFSNQALEDIAEPLNGTVKDAERYNRRLDVDGEFNKDTNKSRHNHNKYYSEMVNGESIIDLKKPVKEETKKPGVDMAKVTKLYLQKVEKKIVALTNEESELEEAVKVMEETHKKLMENYVDPSKAKDMMVVDCHTSMSQQKQYFDKMEDKLAHEHSKLVARALKEKEHIMNVQKKLDVRSHCRSQILYLLGDESPDHIMDDMLVRHEITSTQKKKIQHIPYLL